MGQADGQFVGCMLSSIQAASSGWAHRGLGMDGIWPGRGAHSTPRRWLGLRWTLRAPTQMTEQNERFTAQSIETKKSKLLLQF